MTAISYSHETSLPWDEYVRKHPGATYCHLEAWREIFRETYGHKDLYLLAHDGDRIVGVLPLFLVKGFVGGSTAVSMPFLDSGGVLADTAEVEELLLLDLIKLARRTKARTVELRNVLPPRWMQQMDQALLTGPSGLRDPESGLSYFLRRHKVGMMMALPGSGEALMASFGSKLRSQIRRPIKEGCKAVIGGQELVDEFYAVFTVNMRDLGSPVHSKKLFVKVMEKFPDDARIFVIRKEHKPIAASLAIGFGQTLSNPWASSLREYRASSPNMLLYWTMLEYASEKGFGYFDFGRSSSNEGTFKFKEQWGAAPHALNWCYISPNGGLTGDMSPGRSGITRAIRYWKKLPVPLAGIVGPIIRKHIAL